MEHHTDHQEPSLAKRIKTVWNILRGKDLVAKQVFIEYHLIRRKYVLSRTSEHFGKDKFEPAPLLNLRLLDIGCGNNRIAQELALRGADCVCIDPDADVLTLAEQEAQKYGAPITFLNTTAQKMVQEGPMFDIILCLDVLDNSKNGQQIVWAMKKMLNPGGMIVFSATNNTFESFFYHKIMAEYVLRWLPRGTQNKDTFINPKNLSQLLAKEGLEISQTVGVYFNPHQKDWYKTGDLSCRYMGVIKHKSSMTKQAPQKPEAAAE